MFGLSVQSRELCAVGKPRDSRASSPETTFYFASAAQPACAPDSTSTSTEPEHSNLNFVALKRPVFSPLFDAPLNRLITTSCGGLRGAWISINSEGIPHFRLERMSCQG